MKNILFIVSSYYPRPSANGICVEMLAKEYLKRGCNVFCLCHQQSIRNCDTVVNGVHIFYVRNYLSFLIREKRILSKNNKFIKYLYYALERFFYFYRIIINTHSFPLSKNMADRFYKKGKKLCLNYSIDTIIAINLPIESVYAGMRLKKDFPDIKYIAYFLDPINDNHTKNNIFIPRKKAALLKQKIENEIFLSADKIMAQINHKKQNDLYLVATYKEKIQYIGVPLLTDKTWKKVTRIKKNKYIMIFAGMVSNDYRPPLYILNVIALSKKIELKMFLTGGFEYVDSLVKKMGIKNINVSGPVNREMLLNIYEKADCMLNIGNNMNNQMPSKIFEYMSYGKPIISTYRINNDTSKEILDMYPAGLCLDEREKNFKDALDKIEKFLEKDYSNINFELLKKIYPEYLPSTFIDSIVF